MEEEKEKVIGREETYNTNIAKDEEEEKNAVTGHFYTISTPKYCRVRSYT